MKIFWITTMAMASVGCATAQDVPPPPPLRGDAASLKDTMKFIEDRLPGKVNYIVYTHDNVADTDLTPFKRSFELSNVSTDAGSCHVGFHLRFDNGKNANVVDRDEELFLKQVREIALSQMDQVIQRANAKAAHPELNVKVDPPIFLVVVKWEKHSMMFNFYDDALADRVSKALQHAVDLCGGGSLDPF